MSDIFEEVEEEVRRAHYEALWKKYGQYLIAAAVVVVIGIAGWQWYKRYEQDRREAVSNAYQSAQQLATAGKFAEAEKAFAALADAAPDGYRILVKFRQAGVLQNDNKIDAAAAIYSEIAASNDTELAASAKLKLAWIHAEKGDRAAVEKDVAGLNAGTNPWRYAANEVLAYADLKKGMKSEALNMYTQLANDLTAPQGVRIRASAILEYLNANPDQNPATAISAAASASPAAAANSTPAPNPATAPGQEK